MDNNYFSILTNAGINKLAQESTIGERVALAQMGVSDFEGEIKEDFTTLPDEKHRFNINTIKPSKTKANTLVCEGVIASEIGGFHVRKVGIYTSDGVLFALGSLPPSYKPLPSEGSAKEINIKVYLRFSNTANITLKVDNSVMSASKEHVERKLKELNAVLEKRIQDNNIELFKILINIRELRRILEEKIQEEAEIGKHAYFLADKLPKGYLPAGANLKISEYFPLYARLLPFYADLQKDCARGYFRLPRAGVFIRGASELRSVGSFQGDSVRDIDLRWYEQGWNVRRSPEFGVVAGSGVAGNTYCLNNNMAGHYSIMQMSLSRGGRYPVSDEIRPKNIALLEGYFIGGRK